LIQWGESPNDGGSPIIRKIEFRCCEERFDVIRPMRVKVLNPIKMIDQIGEKA
jgi:hypothetical protein